MTGSSTPGGTWPPDAPEPPGRPGSPWPSWPPEVPSPGDPPEHRPPTPPPIPMVYEDRPLGDQLAERLLEQRKVLVGGYLDHPTATNAAALLMLLDGSGDDPIELVLSCPDGDLTAAMALADTVELVGVELRTLCAGSVGGPAVLPYALGSRRLAQPHGSFRLSEPQLDVQGPASRVASETARHTELLADLHGRLAEATGQSVETIAADFRQRRLLTGREARAYGLVDEIVGRRLRTV